MKKTLRKLKRTLVFSLAILGKVWSLGTIRFITEPPFEAYAPGIKKEYTNEDWETLERLTERFFKRWKRLFGVG